MSKVDIEVVNPTQFLRSLLPQRSLATATTSLALPSADPASNPDAFLAWATLGLEPANPWFYSNPSSIFFFLRSISQIQHIDEILAELPPEEEASELQDEEEGENWEDVETSDEEEEQEGVSKKTDKSSEMDMSWLNHITSFLLIWPRENKNKIRDWKSVKIYLVKRLCYSLDNLNRSPDFSPPSGFFKPCPAFPVKILFRFG